MSEKNVARWERTIQRGQLLFVVRCILFFGVVITSAQVAIEYLFQGRFPESIWLILVSNFVGGMLVGLIVWWIGNRQYRTYLANKNKVDASSQRSN